jgi:hypothetical protein
MRVVPGLIFPKYIARCVLPGRSHLRFGEPAREGKVQPLAGDDRLEIGVLAERALVGGTVLAPDLRRGKFRPVPSR